MKTIKPPEMPRPDERVYQIPCGNSECKAILEVGHDEMKHEYCPREGPYSTFTCPHCHKENWVWNLKSHGTWNRRGM